MALTVGELLATITVDDAPAEAGLRRTEQNIRRTAQVIEDEAGRAGQAAGRELGEQLAEESERGAERAGSGITSALGAVKGALIGGAIGAALMAGLSEAVEQDKGTDLLAARLGATPEQSERLGKAAGKLFTGGYSESVEAANEALQHLWQQGLVPADATAEQLQQVGGRAQQVADILGEEVGPVAKSVGQMLKTGMAKDADEAFDILVRGTQLGANKAEDLLDTFNEYPTQFRDLGIDGKQAMGLIHQGLEAGARDADVVADAFKELNIRVKDGSAADGLKSIGLNADKMAAAFNKGGPEANAALDQIMDRLRQVKDPSERSKLAFSLLGTQAEDLSKALFSLDPSSAVAGLGAVDGAAAKAGDTMRDNASTRWTAFTRGLQQGAVDVLGSKVVPALMAAADWVGTLGQKYDTARKFVGEHSLAFSIAAGIIGAILLPTLIALGVQATVTTATTVAGWAAQAAAAVRTGATYLLTNAEMLAGWAAQGVAAVAAGARVVGAWVLMGAQSLLQAARMAAAWVIALGPVGWIIAAVVGLVALVVSNWDTVSGATAAAWNWIVGFVKSAAGWLVDVFLNWTLIGLLIKHWDSIKSGAITGWNATVDFVRGIPGHIVEFFLNWTLVGLLIKHWDSIRSGVAEKASGLVSDVKALPGRIAEGLGNLGSLLVDKGRDIVRGLWSGIQSMGGWLKDTLMGWAKNLIPGPIAKALGIHSPSRVMARQVGRWIPAGIVSGIEGAQPELAAAMRDLVEVPDTPALAAAARTPLPAVAAPLPAAAYGPAGGQLGGGPLLHIEQFNAGGQSPEQLAAALGWELKVRG
ncbi:Phage-related minor tail protein [Streptomyces sp. TLI_053]|uniref:phage tail tape measure protein n=1 Tax=Streptomyces sp. TLI_053 TaxID=1855352 RepID=UPI00087BD5E9|nr:phage tail tape measure protein [Streptomyces sp. TLI_053]SDT69807.1 Phage-related minor tail protein [Streptomyces sp. TLI_053]